MEKGRVKCALPGCDHMVRKGANRRYCVFHKGLDKWKKAAEIARLKNLKQHGVTEKLKHED